VQLAQGVGRAYSERLTNASRLHRNRIVSLVGIQPIVEWLDRNSSGMSAKAGAAEASNAGDIGYSYGTYDLKGAESGPYVRVWARDSSGKWFVMADVAHPTKS
jgi:hypothetical protein